MNCRRQRTGADGHLQREIRINGLMGRKRSKGHAQIYKHTRENTISGGECRRHDRTGEFWLSFKKIVTVDTLFLNEDRHFHNLAVIQRKDGTFRECPIFDNGAAIFSDVKGDYPLEMELEACYEKIEAKPFSRDFDEQLDACEILFGGFSFQAFFTMKDVETVLKEFQEIYEERILNRVYDVMRRQMRKYSYLFGEKG